MSYAHLDGCLEKALGFIRKAWCLTKEPLRDTRLPTRWANAEKIEHSTLACLWQVMLARDYSRQLYKIFLQRLTFGFVNPWPLAFGEVVHLDLKGTQSVSKSVNHSMELNCSLVQLRSEPNNGSASHLVSQLAS